MEIKETKVIRNFPEPIWQQLKADAAIKGIGFHKYLVQILTKEANKKPKKQGK